MTILFSLRKFLLIPPVIDNSNDKCPNDKNQFDIYFEPALNGRGKRRKPVNWPEWI